MLHAIACAFLLIAAVALDERPPVIIVTGLAHGGTTVTSELIMTAPGLLGPFETGFLLANRPAAFINTKPFAEWTQGTGAGSLGLAGPHFRELLWQLGLARRHPRVHTVSFEDLFVHRKGRTRKALFEFLGLKGFSPDFSGRALAAKRGRCHLCDHSVAKHRRPRNETVMKEAAHARRR